MPEHGDHDKENDKFYCGYWMSSLEWDEIHKYAPRPEESEGHDLDISE